MWMSTPGYESLRGVLIEAFARAAATKGVKRHAREGEVFEQQSLFTITRAVGLGFPLGQAMKKIGEHTETSEQKVTELLDAIVYLSAAVIAIREKGEVGPNEGKLR